jgi:hypothetical protein
MKSLSSINCFVDVKSWEQHKWVMYELVKHNLLHSNCLANFVCDFGVQRFGYEGTSRGKKDARE